ncbi:transcriptional regulator, TetR family [Modestobacter sp. DSM 44400]|uniref:TetR/AcrR family transcriptional regulator n=1 Tax=Modestobacter sp. DSM 44400 TaxID=1550230 RepID=UPI00089A9A09|nr:TetR/AcrR family transcriptional regulator [Modestobacter sp. DSM 44400]SDY52543.1 transcriptional regulator, TetR family [Modestobacter sp. DSM 44400]
MGRPRSFDEPTAVAGAARLFASSGYEGTSVDDLVRGLGVHRGSLYSTFGSKRALYLRALREHLDALPEAGAEQSDLTLLLCAAMERAPIDADAAALVGRGLARLAAQLPSAAADSLAELIGQHVIARATSHPVSGTAAHSEERPRPSSRPLETSSR